MKKFLSRKLLTTVAGFILFVIMFFIWFTYPTWIVDVKGQNEITASLGLGSFGDSYGALNTLFSGLAFSAVLITLLVQANQLVVTHKELDLTRLEMKEQSKQFEKQTLLMNKQLFEGTFLIYLTNILGSRIQYYLLMEKKGIFHGKNMLDFLVKTCICSHRRMKM
ncbi:TPA: hypothetical protein ACSP2N_004084, partial [Aeromonas veronii]